MRVALSFAAGCAIWAIEDANPTRRIIAVLLFSTVTVFSAVSWLGAHVDALHHATEKLRSDTESELAEIRAAHGEFSGQVAREVVRRDDILTTLRSAIHGEEEYLRILAHFASGGRVKWPDDRPEEADDPETETPSA